MKRITEKDLKWKAASYGTVMAEAKGFIIYHQQYDNIYSIANKGDAVNYVKERISKEDMLDYISIHENKNSKVGKTVNFDSGFELTGKEKEYDGITLYRIRATKDNKHVKRGHIGGWVEDEFVTVGNDIVSAISDNAWLGKEAMLIKGSRIEDDALLTGNTIATEGTVVSGSAKVNGNVWLSMASIYGNAQIEGNASVIDSIISENAIIKDEASVSAKSEIKGNTLISKNASISGTVISGNVKIKSSCHIPPKCSVTGDIEIMNSLSSLSGMHLSRTVEINGEKWGIGIRKEDNPAEKILAGKPHVFKQKTATYFYGSKNIDKPAEMTYSPVIELIKKTEKSEMFFLEMVIDGKDKEVMVSDLFELSKHDNSDSDFAVIYDMFNDAFALYNYMTEFTQLAQKYGENEAADIIANLSPMERLEKLNASNGDNILKLGTLKKMSKAMESIDTMFDFSEKNKIPFGLLSDLKKTPEFGGVKPEAVSIPSVITPPPSPDMYILTVEDVGYNISFVDSPMGRTDVKIEGCTGSVLWELNNDPSITGNRFTDERFSSFIDTEEGVAFLDFDFEEEDIIVKISPEYIPREEKIDILTEWVSENLDRIKTIGYETLSSEESVLEKVSNLGLNTIEEKEKENQNGIKGNM